MLPPCWKFVNPKPAGFLHCVPAMMHGALVLCGPSVCGAAWSIVNTIGAACAIVALASNNPRPMLSLKGFDDMTASLRSTHTLAGRGHAYVKASKTCASHQESEA